MFLAFALIIWITFFISFARDRGSYLNCVLIFIGLGSTIIACCSLVGDGAAEVLALALTAFLVAVLIVPFFLIINGIVMMRRSQNLRPWPCI